MNLEFKTINAIKQLARKPRDGDADAMTTHYVSNSVSANGEFRANGDFGGDVCANYTVPGTRGLFDLGILFADAPGNIGDIGIEEAAAYTHTLFDRAIFNKMHCLSTEAVMYEANRLLFEQQREHRDAVPDTLPAVFSIYHSHNGILDITSAGHPPVRIVRPSTRKIIKIPANGIPLAADTLDKIYYTRASFQLEEGDSVVYLSDGFDADNEIIKATLLSPINTPTDFACNFILYSLWDQEASKGKGTDMSISILSILHQPFRHEDFRI